MNSLGSELSLNHYVQHHGPFLLSLANAAPPLSCLHMKLLSLSQQLQSLGSATRGHLEWPPEISKQCLICISASYCLQLLE